MARKNNSPLPTGQSLRRTLCVGLLATLTAPVGLWANTSADKATEQRPTTSTQQDSKRRQVIGAITDGKTGEPIIGANVVIKTERTRGAATDIDGKFRIQAARGETLVISAMGYATKEIKLGAQTVLEVTLAEDAKMLGDVVVTAFGTGQKKETVTGAIQTVRPSDLKVPATNLSTAFAGRIAGIVAYQRSGAPGSNGADFFVRGVATMNGATNPLIVLDGVEISSADLNALDPEVIESFSVLKDATTTAMYGTRGANGVLIIKTKSGDDLDKPIIGVRAEAFVNTPTRVPKIVNPETFMRMYNEAVTNQNLADELYSEERIRNTISGKDPYIYPNVDWYKELFRESTFNQRANLNIRGGTNKITYFMNLNASHETGMLRGRSRDYFSYDNNIDYMKYAFQNNIDFNLSKSSKIGLNLNVQMNNFHGPVTASDGGGGIDKMFDAVMGTNAVDFPIEYAHDANTPWRRWGGIRYGNSVITNPMAISTAGYKDMFETTVLANLNFEQKLDFITKGLKLTTLFSFKNWSRNTNTRYQGANQYTPRNIVLDAEGNVSSYEVEAVEGNPTKPSLNSKTSRAGDRRYYLQSILNYERSWGNHNVSGMMLFNMDEYNNNVVDNDDLIATLPKRRMGYAFRAGYDYARKYMLELVAGYNGSENFAEGKRWGFFPAVSAAWNISQEKFWEPLKNTIGLFKIRASYGLVGNDQIGGNRFVYMPIVSLGVTPAYKTGYGNATETHRGASFRRLANNDITWEIGRKLNLGVDLKLFGDLSLTADVFQEIRSNIFQQRTSIPTYLGVVSSGDSRTEIWGNFAKIKNWGFDASLDYGKQISKDFAMQFRGTFTYARNRVLEYDEAPGLRPALKQAGRTLNTWLGYIADGLYIDAADVANNPRSTLSNIVIAPGDIKYVDQPDANGEYDGQITADDRVEIGHPHVPEIVYGFGPTMKYKNFDFSFYFQGQARVSLMMSGFAPFGDNTRRNVMQWIADDYWSIDNQNPNARHPRITKKDNGNNMQNSTFWLRDAAFLKLKNLEVGYTYKNARLYFSATNLLTFAPFKLWDPEMGGGRGMSYPLQRTFNLGLQVTFNKR
ncbi:MAG: TonB-dependent receptor [Porphyromonas sp.]|nr:TonB-dependent receptor [Porphyromonas sp.]